jgi:hypothetical protein
MPSIFDYTTHIAASDAIYPDAPYVTRTGASRTAACFGRLPQECNEDGPENFVLILEYEKESMYTWLMEVSFELGTYPVIKQKFCVDWGEIQREVSYLIFAVLNIHELTSVTENWRSCRQESSQRICT